MFLWPFYSTWPQLQYQCNCTYILLSLISKGSTCRAPVGVVTVRKPLDYEKSQTAVFVVTATDNGHPQLTSTATINIAVENINDETPRFQKVSMSLSPFWTSGKVYSSIFFRNVNPNLLQTWLSLQNPDDCIGCWPEHVLIKVYYDRAMLHVNRMYIYGFGINRRNQNNRIITLFMCMCVLQFNAYTAENIHQFDWILISTVNTDLKSICNWSLTPI